MKGLQDKKINLLYYQFEEQREKKKKIRQNTLFSVILILILIGSYIAYGIGQDTISQLKGENETLKMEIEELNKVEAAALVNAEQMFIINSRKKMLTELEEERAINVEFLEEIYLVSQPDIVIGKMTVKNGELVINAYAGNHAQVIDFVDQLKANPYIKDIKNINAKLNEKNGEVSFNLTLEWEVQ